MKPIEIDVKFEKKDLRQYYLQHYLSAANITYGFFGYLIFGIITTLLFNPSPTEKIFLYVGITSLVFTVIWLTVQTFYALNQKKIFDESFRYIFAEEIIELCTETSYSRIGWEYFVSAEESSAEFRLFCKDGERSLIPKRFIKNEDLIVFKILLKEKLGDRAMLKEPENKSGLR